ncbi:type IX secretion system outer membrane channel protein PorV [Ohtaekwangia sp.]|uniref:type IX secretion system outer membrane channel protein PorV n=1 Tax=Ohtaekwangia sp. TaxID=2066019 RepID=UPI002FDD3BDA
MNLRVLLVTTLVAASFQFGFSQVSTPGNLIGQDNAITTAVPFLAITPDARHAGLGDAGVATSPDANAAYWNAGKLAFIDKKYGGTLSYTPWLGKIVNDMWVGYLSGFYKINREQAVAASLKYFDLGSITFNTGPDPSQIIGEFNPREYAADITYSRLLSENFSIGGTIRYIHSNLTGAFTQTDAKAASGAAVDLGVYYTKPLQGTRNSTLSIGANISNIGTKISYTDAQNKDFIPTNLRLGTAYTTELDPFNKITFMVDFNKLLVPTPDPNNPGASRSKSILSGMFGSFSDAPGGFSEEIKEIMTSVGAEYWYNNLFAARLGYFNEAKTKGNRKYMTIGLGFRKDRFGFDVAYLVPTNKREHPLAETIRFTLLFHIAETQQEKDESVTD